MDLMYLIRKLVYKISLISCLLLIVPLCLAENYVEKLPRLHRAIVAAIVGEKNADANRFFDQTEIEYLGSIRFISPVYMMDLHYSEKILDYQNGDVERTQTDFSGNITTKTIKIKKEILEDYISTLSAYYGLFGHFPETKDVDVIQLRAEITKKLQSKSTPATH